MPHDHAKECWLITGASGFIGSHFARRLIANGHRVIGLSRQNPGKLDPAITWVSAISDCPSSPDHVLNLAGEPIADARWTPQRRKLLWDSRVGVTEELSDWLGQLSVPPRVVISGSAIGYYGISSSAKTEKSPKGHGFSADLCAAWEAALTTTPQSRTVFLRTGVVLGNGGMLKKLRTPFLLGLGGAIGDGSQMLSWISLHDILRLIRFVADQDSLTGSLNATAPNPINNRRFARHFARSLHRPALLKTPATAMRLLFGEMAEELLLNGQTVLPDKATNAGFTFDHPWICRALSTAWNTA